MITIDLTTDEELFVRGLIEEGRYKDLSEVVCEGMRLLQEQEQRRPSGGNADLNAR